MTTPQEAAPKEPAMTNPQEAAPKEPDMTKPFAADEDSLPF